MVWFHSSWYAERTIRRTILNIPRAVRNGTANTITPPATGARFALECALRPGVPDAPSPSRTSLTQRPTTTGSCAKRWGPRLGAGNCNPRRAPSQPCSSEEEAFNFRSPRPTRINTKSALYQNLNTTRSFVHVDLRSLQVFNVP